MDRLTLTSDEDAAGRARAAVARHHGAVNADVLERSVLLTSEAVANAVRHAGGKEVRVDIWPAAGSLAVVVRDDGPGFATVPQKGQVPDSNGGFGLPLFDTLSDAWGSGSDDGSLVWFEVSPHPTEPPGPDPEPSPEVERDELLDVRMIVDSVRNHALIALDPSGNATNWGASAVELTGYPADEMLGQPLSDLYAETSGPTFAQERSAAESEGRHQVERRLRRKDGSEFWAEVALAPIVDRRNRRRGFSALISDATEHKRVDDSKEHLIAELRQQAMTDDLTGLPNRRRWAEELSRELARSRRRGTQLAVVMLDLDNFKAFNDNYGHPAGDVLLQAVARNWSEAVRSTDMLARFGGDEFSITLPDCSPELALIVVGRVQAATPPTIDSSAGIASSDGAETADELVARADVALYDAKRRSQAVSVSATGKP